MNGCKLSKRSPFPTATRPNSTACSPPRPRHVRRKCVTEPSYQAIVSVLVLAGFIGAPEEGARARLTRRQKLVRAVRFAVAAGIWVLTWVVPITFMIAMS